MTGMGTRRRMERLIPPGRAALWLPLDDGLIAGPEAHLRDPRALLSSDLVRHLTAVLGFGGMLRKCEQQLATVPIMLNISASTVRDEHTRKVEVGTLADVIRAGADAVVFHVNFRSPFEAEALNRLGKLVARANALDFPVVAMAYPRDRRPDGTDEHYLDLRDRSEEEFAILVRHCVRVAVELGAAAVKTIYTGSVDSFKSVVSAAMGVPVLIAGERLTSEDRAIERARSAVRAGAAGVAFGRQVFEREDPAAFAARLRAALDLESNPDSLLRLPVSAS